MIPVRTVSPTHTASVENGAIIGHLTDTLTTNHFLWSDIEVGDFYLELDVHLSPADANDGIQIRSKKGMTDMLSGTRPISDGAITPVSGECYMMKREEVCLTPQATTGGLVSGSAISNTSYYKPTDAPGTRCQSPQIPASNLTL